jgi:hypothetical protein
MRLSRLMPFRPRYDFSAYHRARGVHPDEITKALWQKSSWSSYNGNCVEISRFQDGRIGLRDTKDRGMGPVLIFTRPEWEAFLSGAKHGEFDRH